MCIKLPPKDLNPNIFSLHPTNTYICRVTIVLKAHGDKAVMIFFFLFAIIVTSVHKAHNINEHKPQYTKRCCHINTLYKTLSSISHTR